MTTPSVAMPADPAALLRRLLLGSELTSEQRELTHGVLDRAPRLTAIRARGTGLRGLADRVEALDGRLRVVSPPGAGTVVRAELPCAS